MLRLTVTPAQVFGLASEWLPDTGWLISLEPLLLYFTVTTQWADWVYFSHLAR